MLVERAPRNFTDVVVVKKGYGVGATYALDGKGLVPGRYAEGLADSTLQTEALL